MTPNNAAQNVANWIKQNSTISLTVNEIAVAVLDRSNPEVEEQVFQFWETLPRDVAREYDIALDNGTR